MTGFTRGHLYAISSRYAKRTPKRPENRVWLRPAPWSRDNRPLLMCRRCDTWRRHTGKGGNEYGCVTCGRVRRWGAK